jgi:hypothetical protein
MGTLLRIDFFIFFLIIPIYLIIIQKKQRKKLSLYLAFSIFIFLGGQTVFRLIYYGEWLPNTYFLKVSGVPLIVKVLMGVTSTAGLIGDITIPVFLLPFAYFLIKKKFHSVQLVFVIILAQMFYNIYVGGDAWDYYGGANRYWAVIMPLFFIALSSAVLYLLNIAELRLKKVGFADGSLYTGIYIAIIVGIFIGVHSSSYRGHINELLLKRPALQYDEHEYSVAMSRFLGDITTKDARIAGAQAGTVKYFTGRYFIDILGKTDKHIARQRPRMGLSIDDYEKFRPGHNKYDIDYSIKTFHPDVIMGLWGDTASLASYLNNSYQYLGQVRFGELRLRKNSTNILWNEFDFSNTDLIRRYFNIPTTDYNFYKNR